MPIGRTTVYEWAKKGKIRSEETEFGLRILLNDEEINKINMLKGRKNKPNDSEGLSIIQNESEIIPNYSKSTQIIQNNSKPTENEVMIAMLDQIKGLTVEIKELSKESGQVKFLTDNLITKEKDSKFYQDEYFRLKYENEQSKKLIKNSKKN